MNLALRNKLLLLVGNAFEESKHSRDESGKFGSGEGNHRDKSDDLSVHVDEEVLQSAIRHGQMFGTPNVELSRNGDEYTVSKRLGVGKLQSMATGFKSSQEAKDWINGHKYLRLETGVRQLEDPNAEELKDY